MLDLDSATGPSLVPVPVHLGAWSLSEAIDRVMDVTYRTAAARGMPVPPDRKATSSTLRAVVEPVVSLLLYLCSQASDVAGKHGTPGNPEPVRTRRDGWKLFPVPGPRTWDVGVRLGAALRRAYQAEQTGADSGTHAGPRPHIRRAHWHTVLSGPRLRDGHPVPSAQRQAELRWMPPIAVNLEDAADLPATIRKVR